MGNKWSKRPWRRQYTDPSNEWTQLPMYVRALGQMLVGIADDHGFIRCRGDVVDSLCRLLAVQPYERRMVRKHVPLLLQDGYIRLVPHEAEDDDGFDLQIPNFYEAQIEVRKGPKPQKRPSDKPGEDSGVPAVNPESGASARKSNGASGKKRELQGQEPVEPPVNPKDGASARKSNGASGKKREVDVPVEQDPSSGLETGASVRNSVMTRGKSDSATHRVGAPGVPALSSKGGASARNSDAPLPEKRRDLNDPKKDRSRQPCLEGVDVGDDRTPYKRVVDAWFTIFKNHMGTDPVFQAKDGRAAKSLLTAFNDNVEQIERVMENAFHDPYFVRARADLATLAGNPNPYIRRKTPSRQPPREPTVTPLFDNESFGGER